MEVKYNCIVCYGEGKRVKHYNSETGLFEKELCEVCWGTGSCTKKVEGTEFKYDPHLLGISCPAPHTCTDLEATLYAHRDLTNLSKGDVLISGIGPCYENNDACVNLRKRINALSRADFHRLLSASAEIYDLIRGTHVHP